MLKNKLFLTLLLSFVLVSCKTGASPTADEQEGLHLTDPTPPPGGLVVNAEQRLGEINPFVYGANFGPWAVISTSVQDLANASGVTHLRFPGGNWGDQNGLRTFHIDSFMTLAQQMSADVSISVRLRGGSPEAAAEIVRYVNLEKGYNVRHWSIGNEPELYGDYDTERFNREWRQTAEAMRAVDPQIVLIGPEVTQFTGNAQSDPRDEAGRDWMREFLRTNGDLVDIVSIHRYPFPSSLTSATASIDELRLSSREWDKIIPALRTVIQEETGRDLPVALTEINSHWTSALGGEATPDSLYNAIWWADVLGRLISQRVELVNYFSLQCNNSIGSFGLLARSEPRPTYYVYQLYQRFGQEQVYAASGEETVSIYAAAREDGALTVMLINMGPDEKNLPLEIIHGPEEGSIEAWLFDAGHAAEPVQAPGNDQVVLPGQSITLLVIR